MFVEPVPVLALQLVLRRFAEPVIVPVPVNVSFLRMTMQSYYFNLIWANFGQFLTFKPLPSAEALLLGCKSITSTAKSITFSAKSIAFIFAPFSSPFSLVMYHVTH